MNTVEDMMKPIRDKNRAERIAKQKANIEAQMEKVAPMVERQECAGAHFCDGHEGRVEMVQVYSPAPELQALGHFAYCQKAIAYDSDRGFHVIRK